MTVTWAKNSPSQQIIHLAGWGLLGIGPGDLHSVVQSDLSFAIRAPERGCQRRVKGESSWIWKLEGETLVEVWIPA